MKRMQATVPSTTGGRMAKLVVVFGLPGSSKTFHLPRIKKEHDAKLIRDSFKIDSFRNLAPIMCSRHFVDLISNLREGRNCVISDIAFCKKDRRKELAEAVQLHVPDVKIVWIPFENNPEQCRKNVKLVVVFGLPGSGKTFHLPRIKKEHDAKLIRDSFKKESFRNLAPIMCSRHFVDLISNLREGRNCVISDIAFCKKDRRKELAEAVQLHVPDVKIV